MSKYREARARLTSNQRSAMDKEYQDMKAAGKLLFKSKFTGLDYSVTENIGKGKSSKAPSSNSFSKEFNVDKAFEAPNFTGDLTKPQGAKYAPAQPKPTLDTDSLKAKASTTSVAGSKNELAPKGTEAFYQRQAEHKKLQPGIVEKIMFGDERGHRGIIPETAKALGNKLLLNEYPRNDDTFNANSKAILYKVAENAQKRTGKLTTGTMYQDYKGVVSDEVYEEIEKLNKMDVSPRSMINALGSDGYNLATSMGRFSVAGDGKGNTIITDDYDFRNEDTNNTKTGEVNKKVFEGKDNVFAKLREKLAKRDANLSPEELKKLKTSIKLSPQDTVGFSGPSKEKILFR